MDDTASAHTPHGFPFSRAEYLAAQLQVRSREAAEAATALVYEPHPEWIGATVMDGDLVLLALLSDGLARRVVEYRPRISEVVARCRENRAAALDALKASPDRPGNDRNRP